MPVRSGNLAPRTRDRVLRDPGRAAEGPVLCVAGSVSVWHDGTREQDQYWKKRITLVATYPELCILEIQCGNKLSNQEHKHAHVRGSVKTPEGWRSRAALSARYPSSLGLAWGYAISLVVSRVARRDVQDKVKEREVALTRAEENVAVLEPGRVVAWGWKRVRTMTVHSPFRSRSCLRQRWRRESTPGCRS